MSSISLDEIGQSTLTPEELEAIKDETPSDDEIEQLKAVAAAGGNDDDDDDEDDDEGEAKAAPPVEGKTEPKPDAAPAAEPAAKAEPRAQEPEETPRQAQTPRYEAKLPADFDTKVQGLADAETQAWEKFETGDFDRSALQAELGRIAAERNDLQAMRVKAEISQEMTQQSAAQAWESTVNSFMATAAKNDGVDYRKDQARAADLDQFVKVLANKEENSDKPMEWFLNEAHRRVQALYGDAKPATDAPAPKGKTVDRTPPLSAAPKTLAQVPGGDGPGDVGGEFAHLDALDGPDLESALAKMSPAQRDKYAMGL